MRCLLSLDADQKHIGKTGGRCSPEVSTLGAIARSAGNVSITLGLSGQPRALAFSLASPPWSFAKVLVEKEEYYGQSHSNPSLRIRHKDRIFCYTV